MNTNKEVGRRDFFKIGGLSTLPLLLPAMAYGASYKPGLPPVNFIYDGPWFSPQAYLEKLNEIDKKNPIEPDIYSSGGVTRKLEEEFARITGKEKAIYLPSGTMANQLAMKLLNGRNTKVIVPENSHIFRDEADAAQSVHGLRLIPLGKDRPWFDLAALEEGIRYLNKEEVFESGLGTVVIENPIRRADGRVIPLDTIIEMTDYCRENGYRLHLDGARIHIASAWSKVSVSEYASHFDTIYVSLYKYLNAAGGGILCGDVELIDQVPHQIKILGGNMLQSWTNSAMALHYLNGIDELWNRIVRIGKSLISELNKHDGVRIAPVKNGSNVFNLVLAEQINMKEFLSHLATEHQISFRPPDEEGIIKFKLNETILYRDMDEILHAWSSGLKKASG